jgi:nitric oxide reductase large subunit
MIIFYHLTHILKAYLNIRPKFDGPLFCHLNRNVLTRTQFLSTLQSSLQFLGYNTHRINTHSFRIGAATYYAMFGLNEDEIKLKKRTDGAPTHTNVILDHNSVLIY